MPSYFLWDWLVAVQRLSTSNVKPAKYVHDLGIFLDSDMSMKTHVSRTVSSCFAALRQIRSIHRSVSQPVLLSLSLSLVTSLVLSRLDYGSVNLIGISRRLLALPSLVLTSNCLLRVNDDSLHGFCDVAEAEINS